MHLLKVLTCAAVIAPLLSAPAFAQTWEGAYAGLQIARTGHIPRGFNTSAPATNYTGTQADAENIALFAGYNWDVARSFVVGIEADVTFGELTGQGPLNTNPTTIFSHNFSNVKSLRGRVGFDAGRILPFVSFGVTRVDFEHGAKDTALPFINPPLANARLTGKTLGMGADFTVGSQGFLRIEVSQTVFANESLPGRLFVVPITASNLDLTQARIGYALRF